MKYLVKSTLYWLYRNLSLIEQLKIFILKKKKKIIHINELVSFFTEVSMFAFATGGSLSNLKNLFKLHNKNILIMNAGIVHFFRLYNVMPNFWFVHNPDSIEITIREMKKYNLKLDFSNTFIFIPHNLSKSKNCHFSSKSFKKFRKIIDNNATFVLYKENYRGYSPEKVPSNYLSSVEPIEFLTGSSVESVFLPWLSYIGVKEIFFSGVDHMDTGHFWDRKEYYQDINGKPLNFQDIQSNELIFNCGKVAREICRKKCISVYRLEKNETILKSYAYIEFEKAYSLSSKKILPKEIFR